MSDVIVYGDPVDYGRYVINCKLNGNTDNTDCGIT